MADVVFTSASVEETQAIASALGVLLLDGDFIALTGDLGAGKTHFTQGIASALEISQAITSPTFNIVFEYTTGRIPLYHFDLYRLEDAGELEDVDFYALSDADTVGASVVEWADKFSDQLPDTYLEICIVRDNAKARSMHVTAHGQRASELLSAWQRSCSDDKLSSNNGKASMRS